LVGRNEVVIGIGDNDEDPTTVDRSAGGFKILDANGQSLSGFCP
jgi:hypothetical protein